MVAADQRQAERAREQHAGDARGTRGADVDRVEGAVGERLHGGGQAGHADAQAGVVGHVDLRDRRQAPVDLGIGGDDLDLIAATPRERISSIVRVTPCVEPMPSARIATRGVSRSPPKGRRASFDCSLARKAVAGA